MSVSRVFIALLLAICTTSLCAAGLAAGLDQPAVSPGSSTTGGDEVAPSSSTSGAARSGSDSHAGALQVSPGRALFDTHLWPGSSETAHATLTNTGNTDISVNLTAGISAWTGHDEAPKHLQIATARTTTCTADVMHDVPTRTLVSLTDVDHGVLHAGQSIDLCIKVMLPRTATLPSAATTVIDLQFSSIERPTGSHLLPPGNNDANADRLAFTGASKLVAVLLLAVGLTAAGAAIAIIRRQRVSTANGQTGAARTLSTTKDA